MQESAFPVALVSMSGAQLCVRGFRGWGYRVGVGGGVGAPCEGQGCEGVGSGLICVSVMFNLLGNCCLCRIYSPIVRAHGTYTGTKSVRLNKTLRSVQIIGYIVYSIQM
jgi:hypothetical protein